MVGDVRRSALLVTPAFFGYEEDIAAELSKQGFDTTLVDERPSNASLERAVLRVRRSLASERIRRYYERVWRRIGRQHFDVVIVIKAEVVPRWFLRELRHANPEARFVFYTFDALQNAGNCRSVLDCFDERLSFDSSDVEAERGTFAYLPLFYTQDFHPAPTGSPRKWWLSFTGTLHSERYLLAREAFGNRDDTRGFFYVQARWYFALGKYLTREHRNVSWREVSFEPLSRKEIARIF